MRAFVLRQRHELFDILFGRGFDCCWQCAVAQQSNKTKVAISIFFIWMELCVTSP